MLQIDLSSLMVSDEESVKDVSTNILKQEYNYEKVKIKSEFPEYFEKIDMKEEPTFMYKSENTLVCAILGTEQIKSEDASTSSHVLDYRYEKSKDLILKSLRKTEAEFNKKRPASGDESQANTNLKRFKMDESEPLNAANTLETPKVKERAELLPFEYEDISEPGEELEDGEISDEDETIETECQEPKSDCRIFYEDQCASDQFRILHPRVPVCRFFSKGKCTRVQCRFLHPGCRDKGGLTTNRVTNETVIRILDKDSSEQGFGVVMGVMI